MTTEETLSEPPAPQAVKNRGSILTWVNLILLAIIFLGINYISGFEYYRRDLTQDQRYEISSQTINTLRSQMVQDRKTPIKIIFAFQRTTQNYTRMRSLLEEYERYSDRKIEVEFIDPLRQPNRARQIALIYDLEFKRNQVVIDARQDTSRGIRNFEGTVPDVVHVRVLQGDSFILYEHSDGGAGIKAIALQMEPLVTTALISAIEGKPRKIYVPQDKSNFSGDLVTDKDSIAVTLDQIARSLNLQLTPIMLNNTKAIPEDAAGVMLAGSKYDLTQEEKDVLTDYWNRPKSGIMVFLDPQAQNMKFLYNFLREQGVRPNNDRILLRNRQQAYYHINAIFCPSLDNLKEFWIKSTNIEGESLSIGVEEDKTQLDKRRVKIYPLLQTTKDFYGETRYTQPNLQFDEHEDIEGPLLLGVGVQRGNTQDINHAKNTARMTVIGNIDMLKPSLIKSDQKDFIHALMAWITDREELSGKSANKDMTIKLDIDRNALSIIQMITNLALPLLSLLIALIIWNTRRH